MTMTHDLHSPARVLHYVPALAPSQRSSAAPERSKRVENRSTRVENGRARALRGNLVLAGLITVAITAVLAGFGSDASANSPFEPASANSMLIEDTIEVYVVQPGDTLWAIATELARPGEDIRPIVDSLKVATGGSQLEIGQRIIIDHTTIRE